MKDYDIKKYTKRLRKVLDDDRFEHTLGVSYTCAALAMRYEYDIKKAQVAGLLHDCAKCIPDEKKLQLCIKHNIQMTDVERKTPFLLHAKVGAFLAMNQYKIKDKEIIQAIINHTTGKPNMSMLDKIVYIADYIEPQRYKAANLSVVRKMAFEDINLALFQILKDTLIYLTESGGDIDPMTQKAYEYYKEEFEHSSDDVINYIKKQQEENEMNDLLPN